MAGGIKSGDVLSGNDLEPTSGEFLISDHDIRTILVRFAPILHKGIRESDTFFSRSFGGKYADAVPLTEQELGLWDGLFGLNNRLMEKANKGELYVPAMGNENALMLEGIEKERLNQRRIKWQKRATWEKLIE